jgi:hypothetical protein
MNKTTEALKLAEEALKLAIRTSYSEHNNVKFEVSLAAIREALAEQVMDELQAAGQGIQPEYYSKTVLTGLKITTVNDKSEFEPVYSEPVKQEPVAKRKAQVNELIKESARLIGSIKDEGDQYLTAIDTLRNAYRLGLKDAAPVDTKAIRAEALEEAAKVCEERGFDEEAEQRCAAAIRGLK